MNSVINLGVPHLGEQIFDYIDTPTLIQFRFVSHTWKIIAENVLVNRWKDKNVLKTLTGMATDRMRWKKIITGRDTSLNSGTRD